MAKQTAPPKNPFEAIQARLVLALTVGMFGLGIAALLVESHRTGLVALVVFTTGVGVLGSLFYELIWETFGRIAASLGGLSTAFRKLSDLMRKNQVAGITVILSLAVFIPTAIMILEFSR